MEQGDEEDEENRVVMLTYHFGFNAIKALGNGDHCFEEAQRVANYAVRNKHRRGGLSSAEINRHYLPSAIVNQILRKYSSATIKKAKRVHLIVPGQAIKYDCETIRIRCLKLELPWRAGRTVRKIHQIEIHKDHLFINVSVNMPPKESSRAPMLGVDLNTTHHMAVVSHLETGKTWKLDKRSMNIRKAYQEKRKAAQASGDYVTMKEMRHRERNRVRDNTHKLVNKIIDIAEKTKSGIAIENLTNIRENTRTKSNRTTRRATNSWNFAYFRFVLEYKCKLRGIPLHVVDPAYTSQMCSRCIHIGKRNKKMFQCDVCGHHDHADVNAGFNIARRAVTLFW